jgi:phenylacetate-coenzyme A ligase PaaK-like adenylate-forming protein
MPPTFDALGACAASVDVALASYLDDEALAARQRRRLLRLLSHAGRHSPLYREILGGGTAAQDIDLASLPVQRKPELMQRFDDWVTDPALRLDTLRSFTSDRALIGSDFAGRYVVWESSGSSGEPALFVQDAAAMAVYDALEGVRPEQLRPPRGPLDPRLSGPIVFIGAVDGHFASTVSVERLRRLNPWQRLRLHSLSFLQPLPDLMDALRRLAPAAIATYPSLAVMLAEEYVAGRLSHAPREVWTGGETLSAGMRRFVQQAFGCRVVDHYGTSEFFTLASECSAGRLHLNSDWAILEPVDAQGRPAPPGETGATTLLTNLANLVQPLIRYELGDRVAWDPIACECGSRLPVIQVEGRSDDIVRLKLAGQRPVVLAPLALTTVLEEGAGLFDFQLVQRAGDRLELHIPLSGADAQRALRTARGVLEAFLARQGAPGVRIQCRSGVARRHGRSGKVKRVKVAMGERAAAV